MNIIYWFPLGVCWLCRGGSILVPFLQLIIFNLCNKQTNKQKGKKKKYTHNHFWWHLCLCQCLFKQKVQRRRRRRRENQLLHRGLHCLEIGDITQFFSWMGPLDLILGFLGFMEKSNMYAFTSKVMGWTTCDVWRVTCDLPHITLVIYEVSSSPNFLVVFGPIPITYIQPNQHWFAATCWVDICQLILWKTLNILVWNHHNVLLVPLVFWKFWL